MTNPYETLNVDPQATEEEIKRVYRKAAKACHPDKHNGDKAKAAQFREIAEAYELLMDPELRQRFDQTGQVTGGPTTIKQKALMQVLELFYGYAKSHDERRTDLIKLTRVETLKAIDRQKKMLDDLAKAAAILREVGARCETKAKTNVLREFMEARAHTVGEERSAVERSISVSKEMLVILDDYSYRTDEQETSFAYSANPIYELLRNTK